MAEDTYELDVTSGNFSTITGAISQLQYYDTQAQYGNTSPSPYSGAGRLRLGGGPTYNLIMLATAAGSPFTSVQGVNRWIDFFAYFPSAFTGNAQIAGGFYYSTSAAVASNGSNQFGVISGTNVYTAATGNNTIPTSEWVRFAFKYHGASTSFHGESRMFKGANLLGTTPDASVASDTIALDGFGYLGSGGSWNGPYMYVDSVKINDTTWPTRGGSPPPAVPKGWWITKPG